MWTAIGMVVSGAAKRLLKGLSAAFEWLLSDPRNIPLLVCAAMWAVNALLIVPARDRDIAQRDAQIIRVSLERDAEAAAHLGTINAALAASKQAQKDAEANAQRVAREQEIITDAKLAPYRADLAALRARHAGILRARGAAVDPGRADPAGLPGLPDAAGRIDAAPGEAGFLAPGALSLPDTLIASEQALQLDALIGWIEAQSAVRFTPEPSGEQERK